MNLTWLVSKIQRPALIPFRHAEPVLALAGGNPDSRQVVARAFFTGLIILALAPGNLARAAELIMIEEPGCIYCQKFNREIAPAYPKTREGGTAPLRRIQLAEPWPGDLINVKPATLTPTFILVENGHEIDRLAGYPGDEYFWFLLGQMLEKL